MTCNRHPTMEERNQFFNPLKSRELSLCELTKILKDTCGDTHLDLFMRQNQLLLDSIPLFDSALGKINNSIRTTQWECRMPGLIYAWSVDFHASPSVCNIPIYSEIGVVLHPEVDHHPHCEYSGICKNRLKVLELGAYMVSYY